MDPLVSAWLAESLGPPTEPQQRAWPLIREGRDVLVSAPTGSGKTLSAFLVAISNLVREARAGTLTDSTRVVYVSPLKALSNDIHRNLELPLAGVQAIADREKIALAPIRAAVRTGDTSSSDRQKMSRKPPHILVTTPESLYLVLTSPKTREMLRTVETVIVDEIHALAGDKRGVHLALSLARLRALAHKPAQYVGLSATVEPLEEVARLLSPNAVTVAVGRRRELDVAVEIPDDELGPVASNELSAHIHDRIERHIRAHRTTLVFVNTRRLAERVSHGLAERLGPDAVMPHHGSLSRQLRFEAESRLKSGSLRAVVATASLELGIDIGSVDIVCQIGSPRAIAATLQRIGRSGHWVGAKPKGRLFPTTRDELIECAALVDAIQRGELERVTVPQNALDILAQQIVAACAMDTWSEDALFDLVRSAYPYRDLPRADFEEVVEMLSEGIATGRGRAGAYLHRDKVNGRLRGRRNALITAASNGGAIPDNADYSVILEPEGKQIGTINEDFAIESMAGDVFTLGTHSWRIRRVEPGRVRVEDAAGAAPSIPFWLGEAPGRSAELSSAVSRVRAELLEGTSAALEPAGSAQAEAYLKAAVTLLGVLPSKETVVAERFFDEAGGMQLVLHSPFGARINRAWGLALRKRFCRTFNFELQAAATDNGIVLSLGEQHSFRLELVFAFLKPDNVEYVLTQALLASPMFTARWRWNATRALAILRFRGGRKVPAPIQRMQADDLMAAVFPDQAACAENLEGEIHIPDHPLVRETIDNCLREAMDVDGLREILAGIETGAIRTVAIDTPRPSALSHEILNANPYAFLDDAPLEERRARAVQLRQTLGPDAAEGAGILDAAAIAQVSEESWPVVRDADELHDALLTLLCLPPRAEWRGWYDELTLFGRAFTIERGGSPFWVATERREMAQDAVAMLRGWLESTGPVTAGYLASTLALPLGEVDQALARLEGEGIVLRGRFTAGAAETEWCNRRILARIHRLTIGRLRREIAPVTAAEFHRFLHRWQHVAPGGQLHGADGVLQIVAQLQGYEIPAAAWEESILPRRVASYDPAWLDELCLSGDAMWGRLSPRDPEARAARPTRIAPVSFFLRRDAAWLIAAVPEPKLSPAAEDVWAALRSHGASFFDDLARASRRLASEVEDALWELVAAGLVTADGFENLRALLDPKRRRGEGRGRTARPRHAAGRWALLRQHPGVADADAVARQLLARWGVVFRDVLARESMAPPWRELLTIYRRMEARGEIRGGRFVQGFTGEQFARPEAVDLLRSTRRWEGEVAAVSNADPLNLAGIILPGERVSPLARMG